MAKTKIASDGRYLAQCEKCGAWVEVDPENPEKFIPELFFEVFQVTFHCCGLRQTATLVKEKDWLDFH